MSHILPSFTAGLLSVISKSLHAMIAYPQFYICKGKYNFSPDWSKTDLPLLACMQYWVNLVLVFSPYPGKTCFQLPIESEVLDIELRTDDCYIADSSMEFLHRLLSRAPLCFWIIHIYYEHESFFLHLCTPWVWLVSMGVKRGHKNNERWSYRSLWDTLCLPGIKPWSSARAASPLNHSSISPASMIHCFM